MAVGEWFSSFCATLRISADLRTSIGYRTGRIAGQLNFDFRDLSSTIANRFYVGSYGRGTAIPSVSDLDLLYVLPPHLYDQYSAHAGNGQSALLSSVRQSIQKTYSNSYVSGDGQVVAIRFSDGIRFEILPAFLNVSDGYTFPDSNGGGSWKTCKPKQEIDAFSLRNIECNKNLVELARMVRAWRDTNNSTMSGMLIDTLAFQFMATWAHRAQSYLYYDYMTRDFFSFLAQQSSDKTYWQAPGSGTYVYRGDSFQYKARQAELRALEAIAFQAEGREWSAKQKYRDIYGSSFPS